jgi:hypothetical protein
MMTVTKLPTCREPALLKLIFEVGGQNEVQSHSVSPIHVFVICLNGNHFPLTCARGTHLSIGSWHVPKVSSELNKYLLNRFLDVRIP